MERKTVVFLVTGVALMSMTLAEQPIQPLSENFIPAISNSVNNFDADERSNSPRKNYQLDLKVGENYNLRADGYWPCPDPTAISPCTCNGTEDGTVRDMDCSSITSGEDLTSAFNAAMPFSSYRTLTMLNVQSPSFTTLDEFSFGIVSFAKINITGTPLQIIGAGTFAASGDALTSLVLSNNLISKFPFESLSTMHKLTELYLDGNNLPLINNFESASLGMITFSNNLGLSIEAGLALNLPNLTSLWVEGCELTDFPPGTLGELTSIKELSIAHNNLTTLARESIDAPSKWNKVVFSGNPITTVEQSFLSDMETSGTIEIVGANIIEFDEAVWRPYLETLGEQSISLEENPLRCGCDIAWLFNSATNYYLKLSSGTTCSDGTLLHTLPADAFAYHCG